MSINKILFIGGAGFIGSNLIKVFIKNKRMKLFVFEHMHADLSRIDKLNGLKIIRGSLKNQMLLKSIVLENNISIIIHLASTLKPSSTYNEFAHETEDVVLPTIKLIKLCAESKILFVFFSSGGTVYGNQSDETVKENNSLSPICYYGYSKQLIESYILFEYRINSLPYLIIRPSNPFGPGQSLDGTQGLIAVTLGKIFKNEFIEIRDRGKTIRDYIYIDDLVIAIYQLITKKIKNEIINIGSGVGYSVEEILTTLEKITNKKLKKKYSSKWTNEINKIVLNISKLESLIKIKRTSLQSGIIKFYNSELNGNNE